MIFVAPRTMLFDALRAVLLAALMMLALLGPFPVAGQAQLEGEYGFWVTDSGGGMLGCGEAAIQTRGGSPGGSLQRSYRPPGGGSV